MALIPCPECKRAISSLAASCPDCGAPIGSQLVSQHGEAAPAAGKKDGWDIAVSICTMIGMIGIPVVLAFLGNNFQRANSEQQIRKDYVQLAVGILSTRPISKDDPLRPWAVQLINEHSPVKLTMEQRKALMVGRYVWKRDDNGPDMPGTQLEKFRLDERPPEN